MVATRIVAARMEQAHEKALDIVREHGSPERVENMETIGVGRASIRNPDHLASFQAELHAGQGEMIADLVRRITELENAAPAASTKGTKKS